MQKLLETHSYLLLIKHLKFSILILFGKWIPLDNPKNWQSLFIERGAFEVRKKLSDEKVVDFS